MSQPAKNDWIQVNDSQSPFDGWIGKVDNVIPPEPGVPTRYVVWTNGLRLRFREGQVVQIPRPRQLIWTERIC